MVSHIPSFWSARFDETSEDALGFDIIYDCWLAFDGLTMQEKSFDDVLKWYYILCVIESATCFCFSGKGNHGFESLALC